MCRIECSQCCVDDPAAWHGGVSGRPLPCNAGDSQKDFNLLSKWLADCLECHSQCRKTSPDTRLPSRVIDVGPPDGTVEPFLLESCGGTGLYTTLSHCWGGEVPLTTTTTTLESRKKCISFVSLPRTFQDAVMMTRKLRICYLWIDSLCILQNSQSDWEKESTMMGEIYASGYLNIAARGATNARSGCFLPRLPEPSGCRLTYKASDKSVTGSMYIRDPSYQTERLKDAPLDQRGWVLQERLLAPRITHYGRQQLYWECSEVTIRQDGKHYDVATDDLRAGVNFKQSLDFNATGPFSSFVNRPMLDDEDQLKQLKAARFLQWYNVVAEYSTRSLTFSTDKLPAIAGIAKAFHTKFSATYIAGLWKEDLLAGLAWTLGNSDGEATSETLPSWSWARWKGDVHFWSQTIGLPLRILDDACSLISVECTPLSPMNPYGDVYAKLYLRGRVLLVTYRRPSGSLDDYLETTVFAMDGRSIGRVAFDSCHHLLNTFSCFLIHGGSNYAAALALEPDPGCTERFRRVGYVSVHSWKKEPDGRDPFMEVDSQIICLV